MKSSFEFLLKMTQIMNKVMINLKKIYQNDNILAAENIVKFGKVLIIINYNNLLIAKSANGF